MELQTIEFIIKLVSDFYVIRDAELLEEKGLFNWKTDLLVTIFYNEEDGDLVENTVDEIRRAMNQNTFWADKKAGLVSALEEHVRTGVWEQIDWGGLLSTLYLHLE